VQILGDLLSEPSVQLFWRIEHKTISLRAFFAGGHQSGVLISFEETWHLGVGEERIHPL